MNEILLSSGVVVRMYESGTRTTVSTESLIAALKAAPAPVREDIGVEVYDLPKAIEGGLVRRLEHERDAANGRADRLQRERDSAVSEANAAIKDRNWFREQAEISGIFKANEVLGTKGDETIVGAAERVMKERDEAILEVKRLRSDAERFSEFHAMQEDRDRAFAERDEAIRERDAAQSARDVATSELALEREIVRNLYGELAAERTRREKAEKTLRLLDGTVLIARRLLGDEDGPLCEMIEKLKACAEKAERELGIASATIEGLSNYMDQAEMQIARLRKREPTKEEADGVLGSATEGFLDGWTARRCIDCGCWVFGGPTRCTRCAERIDRDQSGIDSSRRTRAPSADLPLAPGSRWVDGWVVDENDVRVGIAHGEVHIHCGAAEPRNVLAVLAKHGLLPQGDGVPMERVYPLLVQCVEAGIGNTFVGRKEATGTIADRILAGYGRETKEPAK